ncbi:uncharacterized protein K460DRAFT_337932 [Cucurbitaria berberidis CBS 394.84]|uniref:DUF3533 domain-containing protein n=1 Tax=Cucurbitaria berberidis CBS 394.84 TaxID=1168544 RepID=A0A9P4GHU7_9PLEO|nr:uncharacterized protein K460DRAFT_337932 [Cucurbitaria berberidis CBS 394.84]KAF1845577.1 hypothetical protein K460DRAFT_337932 [Cucurbitaria berberidis CBS 394.84]
MPIPALGCQIAPHYNHDPWPYNSDSTDSESGTEEHVEETLELASSNQHGFDVEKAETQPDNGGIVPVGRPTTLQRGPTQTSRKEVPLAPVGFWDWQMAGVRLHVLNLWFRTNLILAIAIMAFLCLFWGALFRQNDNVKALSIWVVDFDGQAPYSNTTPFVGPFVTQSIQTIIDQGGAVPGYTFALPTHFGNDPLKVRESVYDFDAWAAVIINPNATALLEAAVREGNASYDPLGACQIVYNSARDQTTSSSYIVPSMTVIQKRVVTNFGRAWITHLLQNNVSATELNLEISPQAISPGIEFTMYDLRPFGPPIATPAVSIGLIYLIIISFFSFTFFLPIHMKYLSPKGHPPLHFSQLIIWRYVATVASYFFLSLVYSFVSLAFLMPMDRHSASHIWPAKNPNAYGRGTFVVYWMGNWVGMAAFGLASENMAMLLGTPWTALWLIFWVISNVATGFYALELAPSFYRWGYAWPMHNIVELTRSILFDLHPRTGLNFGILFAWCAVDTLFFPMCCYYMRWNTARVKKQAANMEAEWHAKMEKEREAPSLLARVTTVGSRKDGGPRGRDVEHGTNRTTSVHAQQAKDKESRWVRAKGYLGL